MSPLCGLTLLAGLLGQQPTEPTKPFSPKFCQLLQNGDVEAVKALLAKDPKLATKKTEIDQLPLEIAANHGNIAIADLLLAAGAELGLESAVELGKIERVAAMLKEKPWLAKAPLRPLHRAAARGHLDLVKLLLANGADVNLDFGFSNISGRYTPLSEAVLSGHFEIAKLLCEKGAKTDVAADKNNDRLFHFVVAFREPRFVKLLLENGSDPDAFNENGVTPLHAAAFHGNLAKVKLLVQFKASVNIATDDGATPLFFAAVRQHQEVCEFLLSKGAKLDIYSACALGKTADVESLLKADPKLANSKDKRLARTPLFWAARSGDPKLVKLLLTQGADVHVRAPRYYHAGNVVEGPTIDRGPNERADAGETPLHVAAEAGRVDAVHLLLEKGADANSKDKRSGTPLHQACANHHPGVIELLLKRVNLREQKQLGAELLAAALEDKGSVKLLLAAGADPNVTNDSQGSILLAAAYDGHSEVVALLLDHGAKPGLHAACLLGRLDDVKDFLAKAPEQIDARLGSSGPYYDETPLMLAARAGHLSIVEFLVSKGAKYKPADFKSRWPMSLAAQYGRVNVVEWFLVRGIPVDAAPADMSPALVEACAASEVEVVRLLLQKKATMRPSGWTLGTPLHNVGSAALSWADEQRQTPASRAERARHNAEIARLLIEHGAVVDARDKQGQTPLHAAARDGLVAVATVLVSKGADVNARDHYGRTPLWIARHWSRDEPERRPAAVAELLEKHAARK
jgi:ankyrin repeat protein